MAGKNDDHRGYETRPSDARLACHGVLPTAVIISDVLLYREGVHDGMRRLGGIEIIAAIGSAGVEDLLERPLPDLVIIDASRPATLSVARTLAHVAPGIRIIGFGIGDHDEALAGVEAGITAFVGQEGSVADIREAALRALRGEAVCSPELTAKLLARLAALAIGAPAIAPQPALTGREREIAQLVGDGLSNKEIAHHLGISPATVKNHVHTILDKLDVTRRSSVGARLHQARPMLRARTAESHIPA
jgi:DNA-binding NarL/FixJ family response regulator